MSRRTRNDLDQLNQHRQTRQRQNKVCEKRQRQVIDVNTRNSNGHCTTY